MLSVPTWLIPALLVIGFTFGWAITMWLKENEVKHWEKLYYDERKAKAELLLAYRRLAMDLPNGPEARLRTAFYSRPELSAQLLSPVQASESQEQGAMLFRATESDLRE